MYIGDYAAGDTIDFKFTTRKFSTGAPFTLAGTPAISIYKSNSTTQSTSGITLTADFDSVTGLNHVRIDTTSDGTFYADGSVFDVVITTGTVDSVSVVGEVVGRFTLRAQAVLYPTTAGRKLDVTTGGEAGVDWANVGSPTTSLNLSGTTVGTVTSVASGGITATSIAADAIGASELAADAVAEIADAVWDEAQSGHVSAGTFGLAAQVLRANRAQAGASTTITLDASASATDDIYNDCLLVIVNGTGAGQARIISDYVGSTKIATVAYAWTTNPDSTSDFIVYPFGRVNLHLVRGAVINNLVSGRVDVTVGAAQADTITASSLATDAVAEIADGVWDEARSGHVTAGTFGEGVASVQGNVTGSVASVTGNVGGNVSGSVGSLGATAKTDVNAEVVDALATDTYTEPGQGNPGVTVSLASKIGYLYKNWRNKKDQTSTTFKLYADDQTTVDQKATVSDDGTTAAKTEIVTGP